MEDQLQVKKIGNMILARLVGKPTEELLRECQESVMKFVRETSQTKVLYDARDMDAPPVDVPLAQEKLDAALGEVRLRRAIVVSNTKLAYLARLAFGEGNYRVFYNDMEAAVTWLNATGVITAV